MIIGWDIGGAHLKAARCDGERLVEVVQQPCPLWRGVDELDKAFAALIAKIAPGDAAHVITMTGELVDLFQTREDGVATIARRAGEHLGSRVVVYAGRAGFVAPDRVERHVEDIAAANWHATASLAARRLDRGVLVDTGSTTTDIIPFRDGAVRAEGYDDTSRLISRELVYSAVIRTFVMAVAPDVAFDGTRVPLMAEYFADMADVYRITGELDPAHDQSPTADGRGKSLEESCSRLARMIGRNLADAPVESWRETALDLRASQLARLEAGLMTVLSRQPACREGVLVAAGAGSFLVRELARRNGIETQPFATLVDVAEGNAGWADTCAPAAAVALLYSALHDR